MDVAITISSDGDKANVLIVGAASYLNPVDSELRASYFNVAKTIGSDGDLARVLINAAPFGHQDSRVTEAVIDASFRIESDGDKANVLTFVATQRLLTSARVKDAFSSAAMSIDSDGDRACPCTPASHRHAGGADTAASWGPRGARARREAPRPGPRDARRGARDR